MGLEHVAATLQADAMYAVKVDTWGHLAPEKNKKYPIQLTAAVGYFSDSYLNPILLTCSEDGPWHGPWFYDSINEFLSESIGEEDNSGKVFSFVGHWRNYRFIGKWKEQR